MQNFCGRVNPPAATIHFCNSRPDLKPRLVPSILVEVTSSYSGLQGYAWEILIEIQPSSPAARSCLCQLIV